MYNRYVPQSDGSFQRNRIPDQPPSPAQSQPAPPAPPVPSHSPPAPIRDGDPLGFLRQLLPQGFDLGDLAIVFLLLLMAGDSKEQRDSALLTMALYFIL